MEFVLPILDYREVGWWHRTGRAHDEPLAIHRDSQVKVAATGK